MICSNCGKENNENTKFCTECGNSLILVKNDEVNSVNNGTNVDNSINDSMNVNNSNLDNNLNNNVKKKHTGLIITLVGCFIVVIIAVAAVILWKTSSNSVDGNDVNSNNTVNSNSNNNQNNTSSTKTNPTNDKNNLVTKFDNYNVDITMDIEVSGTKMVTTFTGTVDEKNQIEYLKANISMMGMSITTETYTDFKNGITYMSEPITGGWIKESESSQIVDLNSILDSLINMENVTKVDDNHFKVLITNNDIKGILEASDVDFDDISGEISADVFTNNGYIDEIDYDFSNLVDAFEAFTLNMKISNYNSAGSVTIPDEVIESATEY